MLGLLCWDYYAGIIMLRARITVGVWANASAKVLLG